VALRRQRQMCIRDSITGASSKPGIAVIEIKIPALVAEPVN
jgi:hypothetical protein